MPRPLDVLWALLLIGVAVFVGGILFRRVPSSWLVIGAVLVVFGLGIPALVIDDNKSETAAAPEPARRRPAAEARPRARAASRPGAATAAEGGGGGGASAEGKLIFTQSCGTCHTLADAGTNGQVGPNLDDAQARQGRCWPRSRTAARQRHDAGQHRHRQGSAGRVDYVPRSPASSPAVEPLCSGLTGWCRTRRPRWLRRGRTRRRGRRRRRRRVVDRAGRGAVAGRPHRRQRAARCRWPGRTPRSAAKIRRSRLRSPPISCARPLSVPTAIVRRPVGIDARRPAVGRRVVGLGRVERRPRTVVPSALRVRPPKT